MLDNLAGSHRPKFERLWNTWPVRSTWQSADSTLPTLKILHEQEVDIQRKCMRDKICQKKCICDKICRIDGEVRPLENIHPLPSRILISVTSTWRCGLDPWQSSPGIRAWFRRPHLHECGFTRLGCVLRFSPLLWTLVRCSGIYDYAGAG